MAAACAQFRAEVDSYATCAKGPRVRRNVPRRQPPIRPGSKRVNLSEAGKGGETCDRNARVVSNRPAMLFQIQTSNFGSKEIDLGREPRRLFRRLRRKFASGIRASGSKPAPDHSGRTRQNYLFY